MLKALDARKPEDVFFIRSRGNGSFFKVMSVDSKPLTGDEAAEFAKREVRAEIARKGAEQISQAALATTKYEGDYARIMSAPAPARRRAPRPLLAPRRLPARRRRPINRPGRRTRSSQNPDRLPRRRSIAATCPAIGGKPIRGTGDKSGSASSFDCHPLFRRPADMPLMVSWIPVSTFSLAALERWSLRSSTCTWLSGSR